MEQMLELLTWEPNRKMQYEIMLMLLFFLLPAVLLKKRRLLLLTDFAGVLLFAWLHGALLPFVLSGLWAYTICGLFCICRDLRLSSFALPYRRLRTQFLSRWLPEENGAFSRESGLLFGLCLVLLLIQLNRINIAVDYDSLRYGLRSREVLLNGHGLFGFFENPGLVNTVYTYSKGFELLTLPLSFCGGSYSYVLCFNLWVLITAAALCGAMAEELTGARSMTTVTAAAVMLIPGITNMAVTAKADLLTLLFQLIFLYAVICYLKEEKGVYIGAGLSAAIASYALKPTAMLFTSAIGLSSLLFLILRKKLAKKRDPGDGEPDRKPGTRESEQENGNGEPWRDMGRGVFGRFGLHAPELRMLLTGTAFLALNWLRTFLITGLPVTSVFSGFFGKLGLELRYPFALQSVPAGSGADFSEALSQFLRRLFGVLFCPLGEDLSHVLMAWGGLAVLFLLFFVLCRGKASAEALSLRSRLSALRGKRAGNPEGYRYLLIMLAAVGLLSLISLWNLYQVDGNYYMLFYALTAVTGCTSVYASARNAVRERQGEAMRGFGAEDSGIGCFFGAGTLLLTAVMIYFTAFTGWAGAVGFTPVEVIGKEGIAFPGTWNHRDKAALRHAELGDAEIFRMLEKDGRDSHVIAFADEPECYDLPCKTESYTDIAGSGGNVYLVKTLNLFKEYLAWSGAEYIYADKAWLSEPGNERAPELLYDLIEDGTLTDIRYESDFGEESAAHRCSETVLIGRIDARRAAVPWEVPLSEEEKMRAEENVRKYLAEEK